MSNVTKSLGLQTLHVDYVQITMINSIGDISSWWSSLYLEISSPFHYLIFISPPPSFLNPLKSYLPSPSLPKLKKPQMAYSQPKLIIFPGLPWWLSGKDQETQVQSQAQEDPLEKKWQPTPVFLPEKSHEQRSLAGYSPWGHKRVGHDLAT